MNLEHDASCGRTIHGEELFQHIDHKLHGSVVIIQEHDPVQWWLFDLRPRLFNDDAGIGADRMRIGHGCLYMGRETATQACQNVE